MDGWMDVEVIMNEVEMRWPWLLFTSIHVSERWACMIENRMHGWMKKKTINE
jgi:hypothetical protein